MHNYTAYVRVGRGRPAEPAFFDLLNKYNGVGFSNSENDTEDEKAHFAFISSEKPITIKQLRREFPNLTISGLEKKAG